MFPSGSNPPETLPLFSVKLVSGAAWRGRRIVTPEQVNSLTGGFESHWDCKR